MRAEDRPTRPWRVTPAGIAAAFVVALVCFLLAPAGLTASTERLGAEAVPVPAYIALSVLAGVVALAALACAARGQRRAAVAAGAAAILLIAAPFAHAMLALQTGGPAVLFGLGGALLALLGLAAAARMASPRAG